MAVGACLGCDLFTTCREISDSGRIKNYVKVHARGIGTGNGFIVGKNCELVVVLLLRIFYRRGMV